MKILDHLDARVPDRDALQRAVLLGPNADSSNVSVVVVRIPPGREFPLHTHPGCEDCFFVLSGAGEAFEPARRLAVAAPAGVWVPPGHPHGLRAGSEGMLEIGFQSPPDPTAVDYDPGEGSVACRLQAASLETDPRHDRTAGWRAVFPQRDGWRYLDPHYASFARLQRVTAGTDECELVVVVGRGAVDHEGRRLDAVAALHLGPGERAALVALEAATLLLAIEVWAR